MKMPTVEVFYPNYSKKAITFSIDDGHIAYDTVLLGIVRPAGIRGTFNLCSGRLELTPEEYRSLYCGYEIANHAKYHPYAFSDGVEYTLSDEIFDAKSADESKVYRHATIPDVYYSHRGGGRWRLITDADTYIDGIEACRTELEEIFGEGSVTGFVWPFGEQKSAAVHEHLRGAGYYGVRKTGALLDSTGFNFYDDVMRWSYNATHDSLLSVAELYEAYPDDGRLKVFCFGVHSSDFERSGKWDDLREFAKRYGSRPDDYWYATVREIFEYNLSASRLEVRDNEVYNGSGISLYIKVDGERIELPSGSVYKIL